jgi:hypothetical protein
MNLRALVILAIVLLAGVGVSAHRLDEYLQASIVSIEKDRVAISMRMIPGVAVAPAVISAIDTDGDGVLSLSEQRAYVENVVRDLTIRIDGAPLAPQIVSFQFPPIDQMKQGVGQIDIELASRVPAGGANREIILENHHLPAISAYLMNALVPSDPALRITAQNRNEQQTYYALDYSQSTGVVTSVYLKWSTAVRDWSERVGFASIFRLGLRHIAEGTDHLLFLLALLLPAPLIARAGRWSGCASVRDSLARMLRVVTAFTVGHSLTLLVAGIGLIRVPSRPVEVLIAVSILVSAIHAVRPIFPGREARIAAFFGLIHGLAFAGTVTELGLARWERVASVLAFNLGIETMQLAVVAATLPSLLLLSRTRYYSILRDGGAVFAGIASMAWIVERLLGVHTNIDAMVDRVARHAPALAAGLFALSIAAFIFGASRSTGAQPAVVADSGI